ncbi:MAG TPA: hypothetical protein VGJ95_17345 [Pseudonocardiaceae bacterium]
MTTNTTAEQVTQQVREIADQARDYVEQVLANAKTVGNTAVDAYEQVATTVLGVQHKFADSVKADWLPSIVPAAVDANVQFAEDVNAAYLKAARATLA